MGEGGVERLEGVFALAGGAVIRCRGVHYAVISALAWLAAGCTEAYRFQAPVARFREASAVVIQSAKVYLTALNKNERDAYIYQQLEFRRQIVRSELNKTQVFSDESIAARTKALDQISSYTELLYRLVNNDAPATITAKTADLQRSLTTLSSEVNGLTGENDAVFKRTAGATFPILSGVLNEMANRQMADALKHAVNTGTKPVNELIDAIRVDMEVEYERRRTAASGRVTAAILEYNREFEKGAGADPARLRQCADELSQVEDQAEALRTAQPGAGLAGMQRANEALVRLANLPKPSIHDFATFVDEVESFANTAKRVGDAAQALAKL